MIGDFTLKQRSYYFDNGKFFLIVLVVLGTFDHNLQEDVDTNALYNTIYTFHMPAFILISGYFAKGIFDKGIYSEIGQKIIDSLCYVSNHLYDYVLLFIESRYFCD